MLNVPPRKSPRKALSAAGLTRTGAPRKRAPPRCRICPGAPLKATCPCLPPGRRKGKKADEVISMAAPPTVETPKATHAPSINYGATGYTTPPSNQTLLSTGQALLESLYGSGSPFLTSPAANQTRAISPIPFSIVPQGCHPPDSTAITPLCGSTPAGVRNLSPSPSNCPSVAHTPAVLSPPNYTLQSQQSSSRQSSTQLTSSAPCTPIVFQTLATPSPSLPNEETLPEGAEFVEGAMQGTYPVDISRRHRLPEPIRISAKSVKRFGRVMRELIVKAERLAHQTGSWVIVAGQHPHSQYDFLHFTSLRLHADALEQSSQIVTDFGDLVSEMISAHKADAREFQRNLHEERRLRVAEATAHQAALDEKQAELDYALKMAARYREAFGDL